MSELPEGWTDARVGDTCDVKSGVGFPLHLQGRSTGKYPVFKVGDISLSALHKGGILIDAAHYIDDQDLNEMKGSTFPVGSTVFAKIGEAVRLNRRAFVARICVVDNNVMGVKCIEGHDKFFHHFLKTIDLEEAARSTTVPSIRKSDIEDLRIPLAPLAEQKVIADKLDALLAQVDTLKVRLDAIPAILKRFRQSVLSAAVTGKLTEEWRSKNSLPAPEHQLAGDLCSMITKGASPNWQGFEYVDDSSQTLFVTSENVGTMRLILDKMKYVQNAFNDKQRRSVLRQGDVLTNIVGASIGRSAIWCRDENANINQAVCVLRPDTAKVLSEYLCFYLNSPIGIDDMVGHIVEVARANVSLASINSLKILTPTLKEQTEIVRRVESLFAFSDLIEARTQEATTRVKHLTQSILAKAFRGELTEEWRKAHPELVSGENSAEVLLERIRATRAEAPEAKGKRGRQAQHSPSEARLDGEDFSPSPNAPKKRGRPRKG